MNDPEIERRNSDPEEEIPNNEDVHDEAPAAAQQDTEHVEDSQSEIEEEP